MILRQVPQNSAKSYINFMGVGHCIALFITGVLGLPLTFLGTFINTLIIDFFWWWIYDHIDSGPNKFT
jgi:hypothetical protein